MMRSDPSDTILISPHQCVCVPRMRCSGHVCPEGGRNSSRRLATRKRSRAPATHLFPLPAPRWRAGKGRRSGGAPKEEQDGLGARRDRPMDARPSPIPLTQATPRMVMFVGSQAPAMFRHASHVPRARASTRGENRTQRASTGSWFGRLSCAVQ